MKRKRDIQARIEAKDSITLSAIAAHSRDIMARAYARNELARRDRED